MIDEPTFTVGIEEEYLLVDKQTRDLVELPGELMARCESALGNQVATEFLRSQIEVGTRVCATIDDARKDLGRLRGEIARIANDFGMAPIAASTHPFAQWTKQHHTDKQRYNELARDLQVVGRRMIICGMHTHVGIEDDALRIDILNQASYFLPHLLALTTSSPFWCGQETGLKSYRLSVFDGLPRTGLPEQVSSFDEYRRIIETLIGAGLIEDATKVWWDLRPSDRFPTLEMRITDVCTRLEDALSVAALFRCICRMLYRLRRTNQRWRSYQAFLINENRWRAQRYGVAQSLVDFGRGELVPVRELVEELVALVREDAEALSCTAEVEHALHIAKHGTSADRQIQLFEAKRAEGASDGDALKAVVDNLIAETAKGTLAEAGRLSE